jgi:hypothetical protein
MKKYIAYLMGCVFAVTIFVGCDNNDVSQYSDLMLDTEQLVIDLDKTTEGVIHITNGNGNYKLVVADKDVATATVDDNSILITALKSGKTEITITDWAKKSQTVDIVVKRLEDLILNQNNMSLLVGELGTTSVYSGNEDYTITSSDEAVAKGTIDEKGNIVIEAIGRGLATFTITDQKGKTVSLDVRVKRPILITQKGDVSLLIIGESLEVDILDGNGGYSISTSSTSYLDVSLQDTKAIIKGKRAGKSSATVTIKDQDDSSVAFKVLFVDDPYLADVQKLRYFVNEDGPFSSATAIGSIIQSPEFNLCQMYLKTSSSAVASGYGVRFTGDASVGAKSSASWFKIKSGKVDETSFQPATDLRVDKVEGGWYWISFLTAGKTTRSYIVTK